MGMDLDIDMKLLSLGLHPHLGIMGNNQWIIIQQVFFPSLICALLLGTQLWVLGLEL